MLDEGVCLRVFLENGATLGSGEIEDVRKRTKSAVGSVSSLHMHHFQAWFQSLRNGIFGRILCLGAKPRRTVIPTQGAIQLE